jgi:heme exporter protein D
MQAFFDMGGYGGFVWPAYGLTALVLIVVLVASLRALRQRESALAALEHDAPRGAPRAPRRERRT